MPKTCLNDGVYNEVVKRCQCHAYWDGNYCEVPHCFNGGTLDKQAMGCICPTGYGGFHCEFGMRNERLCDTNKIPKISQNAKNRKTLRHKSEHKFAEKCIRISIRLSSKKILIV